jgi:thiol:disulfide interchange protein DsbD
MCNCQASRMPLQTLRNSDKCRCDLGGVSPSSDGLRGQEPPGSAPGGRAITSLMRFFPVSLAALLALLLPASSAHAEGLAGAFRSALEGGSLGTAMGLSFVAGIGTALTPCVYPMIAITVSVFGARKVSTRVEGALLSSSFVAGMTVLFTALGIVASLTGGVFGDGLSHLYIAGPLALVFALMAASMFGAFELALPASWMTKLSDAGGIGHKGAFVLGMASSIIAAPCVGPVLGLLLPWIGTTHNVGFGVACMVAYSLGMASCSGS